MLLAVIYASWLARSGRLSMPTSASWLQGIVRLCHGHQLAATYSFICLPTDRGISMTVHCDIAHAL